MKTIFSLLVMVGMIGANVNAQLSAISSTTIADDNLTFSHNGTVVSAYGDGPTANEYFYAADNSFVHEFPFETLDPAWTGSEIKAVSGNFVAGLAYIGTGGTYGSHRVYKHNETTNNLDFVRGYYNSAITQLTETPSRIYVTATVIPTSFFGDSLMGNQNTSAVTLNPAGNLVFGQMAVDVLTHDGTRLSTVLFYNPTQEYLGVEDVREVSAGILVKLREVVAGYPESFYYYVLLDKNTPALAGNVPNIILESQHYYDCSDLSIVESPTGGYTMSYTEIGSTVNIEQFDANLMSTGVTDRLYNIITGTFPKLFADGDITLATPGSVGGLMFGSSTLDLRYPLIEPELTPYQAQILSFDANTMTVEVYGTYTGSGNTLGGVALTDVLSGELGVVFATVSLDYSGNYFTLKEVEPDVIGVFPRMERSSGNPLEMLPTDKHLSAMQFSNAAAYENIVGLEIPGAWVNPPAGWNLLPVYMEYDSILDEYYFVLRAASSTYDEGLYERVICTTDALFTVTVNDPPVFIDPTVTFTGTQGEPVDFNVSADDANGDDLTYSVVSGVLPDGLSLSSTTGRITGSSVMTASGYGIFTDIVIQVIDGIDSVQCTKIIDLAQNTTGVVEQDLVSVQVYPNPATDVVNIVTPIGLVAQISVQSMDGKIVFSDSFNGESQLSLTDMLSGMYYVTLLFEDGRVAKTKFVKR